MKWLWNYLTENFHFICAMVWVASAVPGVTIWKYSILFVIIASIYANVKNDITAHLAKKAKKAAEENNVCSKCKEGMNHGNV
jgi:hypothetical protein